MTGGPAAVEAGADGTRLVVPGPDGRAEPVAVLPPGTTPAAALDALAGPSGPVALVHPPDRTARGELGGRAVRPVAAPIAICPPTGVWLVVDAGRGGVGLTVVDDGRVAATERLPAGGDHLDALVAAAFGLDAATARTVRELLSVRDAADPPGVSVAGLEAVLRAPLSAVAERAGRLAARYRVVEVVLAGGVARTPLLAELCDERAGCPVRVLAEPHLAAVRGALELVLDGGADHGVPPCGPAPDLAGPDPAGRGRTAPETDEPCSGAPDLGAPQGRSRRRVTWSSVLVVAGLLLAGAGTALGRIPPAPAPALPGAGLAQYGYTLALPAGWEHTGGEPSRRRTLLTRAGAPDGVELVSVERSPLDYDAGVEPDRAAAELAARYRGTAGLRDLRPDTVAGRAVTRYAQPSGADAVVDWFVLSEGADELAVGCRHPARRPAPELERACAAVVGSAHVAR